MNWKELYALVKKEVSGMYKPAGDVAFAELPELSQSVLGYTYTVTDAFTTDSRFTDYDTETQTGHSFPADTEVAVIVTGTTENPVYMFNVMGGIMDGYATKADLNDYVQKEQGKGLSSNDYTNADKALVQNSPITVTSTTSPVTTASGKPQKITIYGKSEVVDNDIHSVGEGWATVDLGTLNWTTQSSPERHVFRSGLNYVTPAVKPPPISGLELGNNICGKYLQKAWYPLSADDDGCYGISPDLAISIVDHDYDNTANFVSHINGVIFAYQLADPTQGNALSVKTDDGTGIDGTMATFETGLPLYGIEGGARDNMWCDGTDGDVTKYCAEVDLGTLTWGYDTTYQLFYTSLVSAPLIASGKGLPCLCSKYRCAYSDTWSGWANFSNNSISCSCNYSTQNYFNLVIKDTDYTDAVAFTTAMSGVKLVYQLATPTTTPLTADEIAQFNALRTYDPTTAVSINDNPEFEVKAYAGTDNGRAISEMSQDVQSEISALKITQSGTLTLTVNGWSSNEQTIAYAHDTSKRNVIDVDPSCIEEWASCGVYAISETATGITFKCTTVPENALSFKVTSMGVN